MTIPFNDLSRATRAHGSALAALTQGVLESGWLVHGPQHRAFEAEFATHVGASTALGVANGTDALELAMRAVATDSRRQVITAANAGGYAATAAGASGLGVAWADVDPDTHCLDPDSLTPLLDDTVAAVVVTHLYGRAADVEAVIERCRPHGVRVIEDCAQAIGARTASGMVGSVGDIGTFSFYPTKNLGALGDGGAVVTSDAALAERLVRLRQYGWAGKYEVSTPGGRNSRLDELQAAFLRYRLPMVAEGNERRRGIIAHYVAAAPAGVRVLPAVGPGHVGHLAVVETDDASALAAHLGAAGVQTAVHYPISDHRQPAWARDVSLPHTDHLVGRILSLPCFPELTDAEVQHVCTALSTYQEAIR